MFKLRANFREYSPPDISHYRPLSALCVLSTLQRRRDCVKVELFKADLKEKSGRECLSA